MSKEKHLSKYLFQMEAVVFIVLQIFFVTHTVSKLVNITQIYPSFSWSIFSDGTHLENVN